MQPWAFGWRRGVAYAVLWAVPTTVTELSAVTGRYGEHESTPWIILATIPHWLPVGLVIVAFAAWALPRLGPGALTATTPVAAAAASLLYFPGQIAMFGSDNAIVVTPVFMLWMSLFYGSLFVGVLALAYRAERTRALLGQAEIARSRGEALLREAEVAALRGSVDPRFVLRVMDAVEKRFALDVEGADRLLDRLVGFLRLAMPAVRSGASTLGAEIAVVRAFEQIAADLDPSLPRWQCQVEGELAACPFPPLLLLPLLDRLGAPATLAADRAADGALLRIESGARELDAGLMYRLQVGLHTLHGDAGRVRATGTGSLTVLIDLPATGSPDAQAPRTASHPTEQGAEPWTTIRATATS